MNYPLNFRFKLLSFATQVSATDASGSQLFYFKQKKFKLKEHIEIFRDDTKSLLTHTIKADRVIDFSAQYTLADANGMALGSIKRNGAKSIWRASYNLQLNGQPVAHVREANPWVKILDGLFGQLPLAGIFSGYLFHPSYVIEPAAAGQPILGALKKQPAFLEGVYILEAEDSLMNMDQTDQYNLVLLIMMVAMLERYSG